MDLSKFGSRKFLITVFVLILCAAWMFGGVGIRDSMSGAPEQLKGFLGWLGDMTPLVVAIAVWSYNVGQGKVDAAEALANGQIKAAEEVAKRQ